jgi:hypothetical protein
MQELNSYETPAKALLVGSTDPGLFSRRRTPSFLDLAFERLCVQVQMTPAQFDDAQARYGAVAEWLGAPASVIGLFNPTIYPQGSLRIGTTVRPLLNVEFDLDLVVELALPGRPDPVALYKLLWHRLGEHDDYKRMREPKNRCSRLNYADRFHLDLLVAVPDPERGGTAILVPDREKKKLKPSDPKGYAEWFETESMMHIKVAMDTLGIELRATVEPLEQPEAVERKAALKRTVQLLKVARNVAFAKRPEIAPASVVITTLAAQMYRGEPLCADAMRSIVEQLSVRLQSSAPQPVLNPVNPGENFSERWQNEPETYLAFRAWIDGLRRQLDALTEARGAGLARLLREIFGDRAVAGVFSAEVSAVETARGQGNLRVAPATGALAWGAHATGIPVRRNTFFGSSR